DDTVPQVPGGAEVECGGVQVDAGGRDHLERLGADLRPDAVATDHGDLMPAARGHVPLGPFVVCWYVPGLPWRRPGPRAPPSPAIEKAARVWTVRRRAGWWRA